MDKCPIWGTPAEIRATSRGGTCAHSARTGGGYFVSGTAKAGLGSLDDLIKARLTTWLVDQRRLGVDCPDIMSNVIEQAEMRRALPVHERSDRLLEYFGTQSTFVGEEIAFDRGELSFMEMLAWSEATIPDEVEYLLEFLDQRRFIKLEYLGDLVGTAKVSVEGYTRLAELQERQVASKQAFIAMWFDPSLTGAYEEGLDPGIRDAGYEPVRIDRKDHNNKIDDEIIAEIRRSRFLVADFTQGEPGARGGVYYEAGFAHGLNIPVIFTCRDDTISKVHFDTRQYNHITWKTPGDLREKLAQRISATIGDGPLRSA